MTIAESVFSTNSLSIILNHIEIVLRRKIEDRLHITTLAKEVDRNNRLGLGTESILDIIRDDSEDEEENVESSAN